MNVIFQNSKCIIRCIESYGEETYPIPEEIKHLTCGIVPHVLDLEGIGGFLFVSLYGQHIAKPGSKFYDSIYYNFESPTPFNRDIGIYGVSVIKDIPIFILGLVENLISYGLCSGPTETTMDQMEERAREIVKSFNLYE